MSTNVAQQQVAGFWMHLRSGRRGPSPTALARPPRVTWWHQRGKPQGHLNVSAMSILRAKYPAGADLGIHILSGVGPDAGRFAIEPVLFRSRDPYAVRLRSEASSHGAGFSAGALTGLRRGGSSALQAEGGLLIGTLTEGTAAAQTRACDP
jgi:hypothetical protein